MHQHVANGAMTAPNPTQWVVKALVKPACSRTATGCVVPGCSLQQKKADAELGAA